MRNLKIEYNLTLDELSYFGYKIKWKDNFNSI